MSSSFQQDFPIPEGLGCPSNDYDREHSWEGTTIRHFLGVFNIHKSLLPSKPRLADLRRLCPRFPVYLYSRKILNPHMLMEDIFDSKFTVGGIGSTRFFKSRWMEALDSAVDESRDTHSGCGCVFSFPMVQSMIIHNYYSTSKMVPVLDGARFVVCRDSDTIVIEPFRQFLVDVKNNRGYDFAWDNPLDR